MTISSNEIKSGAQRPFKHHDEKARASACVFKKIQRRLASMAVSVCNCFRDSGSGFVCACSLRLSLSVSGHHHDMASTCSPLFCLVEQEGQVCRGGAKAAAIDRRDTAPAANRCPQLKSIRAAAAAAAAMFGAVNRSCWHQLPPQGHRCDGGGGGGRSRAYMTKC